MIEDGIAVGTPLYWATLSREDRPMLMCGYFIERPTPRSHSFTLSRTPESEEVWAKVLVADLFFTAVDAAVAYVERDLNSRSRGLSFSVREYGTDVEAIHDKVIEIYCYMGRGLRTYADLLRAASMVDHERQLSQEDGSDVVSVAKNMILWGEMYESEQADLVAVLRRTEARVLSWRRKEKEGVKQDEQTNTALS